MKKKTSVKKVKKSSAHLEDMTLENKVDYTLVMMEEMCDGFKVFGETLVGFGTKLERIEARGDATFEEMGRMSVRLTGVEHRLVSVESRLTGIETRLGALEHSNKLIKDDVKLVKADVADIKKTLTAKADMKYITLFESRTARLEHRVAQK